MLSKNVKLKESLKLSLSIDVMTEKDPLKGMGPSVADNYDSETYHDKIQVHKDRTQNCQENTSKRQLGSNVRKTCPKIITHKEKTDD